MMQHLQKLKINQFLSQSYKTLVHDQLVVVAAITTVFIIIIGLMTLILFFDKLPSQVPLYYSLPWGKDRLAPAVYLFMLPASAFSIFVVNSIIMFWFSQNEPLISKILAISSVLAAFLSCYTLIRIILLVI